MTKEKHYCSPVNLGKSKRKTATKLSMTKWKPKEGEKYWFIELIEANNFLEGGFYIDKEKWEDYPDDKCRYRLGNCFRTKKEAQDKLKEIKKLLKK